MKFLHFPQAAAASTEKAVEMMNLKVADRGDNVCVWIEKLEHLKSGQITNNYQFKELARIEG